MSAVDPSLLAVLPWESESPVSERRCRLLVRSGPLADRGLDLGDGEVRVGSDPKADLVLPHPSVAPIHFGIRREGDGWLLLDAGSPGGTYHNGMLVRRAWLRPGSQIVAGEVTLYFAAEKAPLRVAPSPAHRFGPVVGDSVKLREIFALLDRIAPTDATVLLVGETGTGKGAFARAIHGRSSRASRSLLTVDCSAISENLIESELFGHERGAFTGAERQRVGMLEAASSGTLFLDEIDDLPLPLQPKLLRALEERVFQRVGSSTPLPFDARILVASKRDLWAMVLEGKFREDLFFRLSVFTVRLPPLRERREDIPALADELLGAPLWSSMAGDVRERLLSHGWPGNVRELRNALERARHLAAQSGSVSPDAVLPPPGGPPLPPGLGAHRWPTPPTGLPAQPFSSVPAPASPFSPQSFSPQSFPPQPFTPQPPSPQTLPVPPAAHELLAVDYAGTFKESKERLVNGFEREYLARLLQRTAGNVAAAARLADVDRKHLTALLKKHGLVRNH